MEFIPSFKDWRQRLEESLVFCLMSMSLKSLAPSTALWKSKPKHHFNLLSLGFGTRCRFTNVLITKTPENLPLSEGRVHDSERWTPQCKSDHQKLRLFSFWARLGLVLDLRLCDFACWWRIATFQWKTVTKEQIEGKRTGLRIVLSPDGVVLKVLKQANYLRELELLVNSQGTFKRHDKIKGRLGCGSGTKMKRVCCLWSFK